MSERLTIEANGVTFAALAEGPPGGPLALCLHGFPDAAPTWRHLLGALAEVGFRAVAPWSRGYAPTSVPADGGYHVAALVADANALHERLGGDDRAVLIGHDWGALTTYAAAVVAESRWRRVVAAAVPPPPLPYTAILGSYDQTRRSWYMFFFQHPLSDLIVPAEDLRFIERLWADWSPGYDASEDLPAVKDALRAPENLAAALGYYRAMLGGTPPDPQSAEVAAAIGSVPKQPTLYLHGADDGCMGADTVAGAESLLALGSKVAMISGAGHFLHLEQPAEVNRLVVDFLTTD